jgi:hypothetical protein
MGIVQFVESRTGKWDPGLYARLLGAANPFKEVDATVGLAAGADEERDQARQLLAATRLREIDAPAQARCAGWTFAELKRFLLQRAEASVGPGQHAGHRRSKRALIAAHRDDPKRRRVRARTALTRRSRRR